MLQKDEDFEKVRCMHDFYYANGDLCCEQVTVASLVRKYRTPLYIYSQNSLTNHYQKLDQAFSSLDHLICFAMKSNSNIAVIRTLANLGGGFDTVSGGELQRVLAAGGDASKCVFAGVGKTEPEIEFALRSGIFSLNAESEPELQRIDKVARRLKKKAPVAVRVNPNVDAQTHAKITTGTYANKFGIAFEEVLGVYARASKLKNIWLRGLQMHIGSQLTDITPFEQAVRKVTPMVLQLKQAHGIEFFSVGGGIGIVYNPALESGRTKWWKTSEASQILTPQTYAKALVPLLHPLGLKILLEPGRFISGNAGILVTRVEFVKRTGSKNFVIVDAAMNDLIRPAFYDSYHEIVPVRKTTGKKVSSDVVGPICESGDFFAKDRPLSKVKEGDFLALLSAGAYGSVMGSNYNTRALSAEVLVHGKKSDLVRKRQETAAIWADEAIPSWLLSPSR